MNSIPKYAVIVAGGKGERMGSGVPKQFLELGGRPVLYYSVQAFLDTCPDMEIILVLPQKALSTFGEQMNRLFPGSLHRIQVVAGGNTRFHSVQQGLSRVQQPGLVLVHDAARPFVRPALIRRCLEGALEQGSAVPAIPVPDSIRQWNGTRFAVVDRNQLRALQTPQTFTAEALREAYRQEFREQFTDEATVAEAAGYAIQLVPGDKANIKITTPEDLSWAESYLQKQQKHDEEA